MWVVEEMSAFLRHPASSSGIGLELRIDYFIGSLAASSKCGSVSEFFNENAASDIHTDANMAMRLRFLDDHVSMILPSLFWS
jgi:hypothetical protein